MTGQKSDVIINNEQKTIIDPAIKELENMDRHLRGIIAALRKLKEEALKFPARFGF